MMIRKIVQFQLLILVVLTVSCSGDKIENDTEFKIIPEEPVIIQTSFKYLKPAVSADAEPEEVEISGSWFQMSYEFTNNSSKQVTIISIKFVATGIDSTGNEKTGETEFTIEDLPINQNSSTSDDQRYLFTVLPGETSTPVTNSIAGYYVHGLPKMPDVINSKLRIKATLYGWVGDPNEAEENFEKVMYFTTQ